MKKKCKPSTVENIDHMLKLYFGKELNKID